jgi:hypothetical protein
LIVQENIEPNLPEITYFGSDFLDFTPPFATPSKKLPLVGKLMKNILNIKIFVLSIEKGSYCTP